MDSKAIDSLFSDDFTDFFSEASMEIDNSQQLLSTLLSILENEVNIGKRLESIQNLVMKYFPTTAIEDIDGKILQYLMPAIKDLLGSIFKEIRETLSSLDSQEKSSKTLSLLQEYLQMWIVIHEVLDCVIDCIIANKQRNLSHIPSVSLNTLQMVQITFQHCKESNNLYKNYFDDLKEIISLFKAAQDVHTKLLKVLDNYVFNSSSEEEFVLLKNVLEVIGEIGEVLVDMNVKSLADNWKGYMALAQKLAHKLNCNFFDISRPLTFLSDEISRNSDAVLKMNLGDQKVAIQTLKICNFFVRVILKLCEIFWPSLERIRSSALHFLSCIYNYYPPFLTFKGYPESTVGHINSLIFACTEQLLNKLVCEPEFFKVFETRKKKETSPGFLFLLLTVFQKLPSLIADNKLRIFRDFHFIVNVFFEVVKESYLELFWKIPVTDDKRSLYDESVINISLTILLLDKEEFTKIQLILFNNIFQDQIWGALLATDIWSLILRKKYPQFCYGTLCQVISKVELFGSNSFVSRPEEVFLANFLQKLYTILSEEFKSKLVEKYPPSVNVNIWKILGFKNFPKAQEFMIESLLINLMDKIKGFKADKCSVNDFQFMCNGFEAISSLSEENGIDLKYLLSILVMVWNFASDESLYDNALFKIFIQKLCQATQNFVLFFDNKQLLVIFTKLEQLLNSSLDIKVHTLQILHSLSNKMFEQSSEQNQIMMILSGLFRTLLQDKNPVIRQAILEVFLDFLNITPHEEIVQNAVKNAMELQKIVSNFIQRNIDPKGCINADEYFSSQKTYKFKHICPDLPTGQKRIKADTTEMDLVVKNNMNVRGKNTVNEEEVFTLVKRIKSDIESLHKLCGKENVVEESITEIKNVLNRKLCTNLDMALM